MDTEQLTAVPVDASETLKAIIGELVFTIARLEAEKKALTEALQKATPEPGDK